MDMNKQVLEPRRSRGLEIANKRSQVARIDNFNYEVLSQSGNGGYLVSKVEDDWILSVQIIGLEV